MNQVSLSMKSPTSLKRVPTCLTALALTAAWLSSTASVSAQALNAQISLRPLTPSEKKTYSLTTAQGASGLNTIGIGQPAYLEVLVANAVKDANITNITWTLTATPSFSSAALAPSPLGTNVPPYKMADRFNQSGSPVYKVAAGSAGRTMLMPDLEGQYTVKVTIGYVQSNAPVSLTQNITASSYAGIGTCVLCHSKGAHAELQQYIDWQASPHASFFARQIDGGTDPATTHYSKNCISCHTVGYDTNTNAVNGGFDDLATQLGWTFPAPLTNGNWAKMQSQYPDLVNLANIQCENCHGPANQHVAAAGRTNVAGWPRLSITFAAGNCAQCHDSAPVHFKSAEWNNSKHAVATRTPSGPTRAACARCHTGRGFANYTATLGTTNIWTGTDTANTEYTAITCATCHDPHSDENPHQLRAAELVKLADGANIVTITNAGAGSLCMNCHQSRTGSYTNSLVEYPAGRPTFAGGTSSFGPHDNPAAMMLEGVNGYTYGKDIPSSAHRNSVTDTCAGCHMQPVVSSDPAFTKAGGHTFSMTYSNASGVVVDKVDVCVQCHGPITSFDMVKVDYNGDGIIEGVQTEVGKLLAKLSTLFPPSTYQSNSANYVADGLVKSPSVKTNWPAKFLQAAWNYQLVNNDLSKGVHNTAYAVGLLKASIADLSGDANNDGIADAWQIQYFGSATNLSAAPNAAPAGDGIPNWLKYTLGLNPLVAGMVLPDGVVWANAGPTPGGTNTIQIYTAAEVAFNTELGKTYQLQAISSLGGGWQPVGSPVPGTGSAYSFVTPTRNDAQQFFRVVTLTP